MELAHVVYRVSTDSDYAAKFRSDPESTIAKLGLKLNKDELASLLAVVRGRSDQSESKILDRTLTIRSGW